MTMRPDDENANENLDRDKHAVRDFWDKASCGEQLYLSGSDRDAYTRQAEDRYALEPYIPAFAGFDTSAGKMVLEIGVGLGADHERFAAAGATLYGVDLTGRAVDHTRRRLEAAALSSNLRVADAERLPFSNAMFDIVYSWGVIHHSPDTPKAVAEIHRVLKTGGEARIMIYHKWSLVGGMLWVRYALLCGRPWMSLRSVYARHLESPGTKAYSVAEARKLFSKYSTIDIQTKLTHGDLLSSGAGQRHSGFALRLARRLWPRRAFQVLAPGAGLFMLVRATK